jgi:hypothetical protein
MEAKECGGGEGIGWVKTGDGAALEEEEWGGRLQRRGDGLPGARLGRLCWMRAFSSVGFRPLDQYVSDGTDRLLWNSFHVKFSVRPHKLLICFSRGIS